MTFTGEGVSTTLAPQTRGDLHGVSLLPLQLSGSEHRAIRLGASGYGPN